MPTEAARRLIRALRMARTDFGLSQEALATMLGSSRRTVVRWERGHSQPSEDQLRQLAAFVEDADEDLAAEILAAGGLPERAAVEMLPVPRVPEHAHAHAPEHAPTHTPTSPLPLSALFDAILYSAANAARQPPHAIRPAVVAAFSRARELGLTLEQAASLAATDAASATAAGDGGAPSGPSPGQ